MAAVTSPSRWGLILAGGDGTRLRSLTRRIAGDERPKQFCRLLGSETLLEQTRRRAARLLSPERILTVVVRQHQRFYAPAPADIPSQRLVIQPENRGTAPAILYGLLRLSTMVSVGSVAIFPSDHYTSDDDAFIAHVQGALTARMSIRELAHVMERAVLLHDLGLAAAEPQPPVSIDADGRVQVDFAEGGVVLDDVERQLIVKALEATDWNRTRAAQLLGVSRDTLRYRMEKYQLQAPD